MIKTKTDYESTYLTTTGVWPDNTTGDITPEDLRAGVQDLLDTTYYYSGTLTSGYLVYPIGSGLQMAQSTKFNLNNNRLNIALSSRTDRGIYQTGYSGVNYFQSSLAVGNNTGDYSNQGYIINARSTTKGYQDIYNRRFDAMYIDVTNDTSGSITSALTVTNTLSNPVGNEVSTIYGSLYSVLFYNLKGTVGNISALDMRIGPIGGTDTGSITGDVNAISLATPNAGLPAVTASGRYYALNIGEMAGVNPAGGKYGVYQSDSSFKNVMSGCLILGSGVSNRYVFEQVGKGSISRYHGLVDIGDYSRSKPYESGYAIRVSTGTSGLLSSADNYRAFDVYGYMDAPSGTLYASFSVYSELSSQYSDYNYGIINYIGFGSATGTTAKRLFSNYTYMGILYPFATGVITQNAALFYGEAHTLGIGTATVNGNYYGLYLGPSTVFNVLGTRYGIYQAEDNAVNLLSGTIKLASDDTPLYFGADDDSNIQWNDSMSTLDINANVAVGSLDYRTRLGVINVVNDNDTLEDLTAIYTRISSSTTSSAPKSMINILTWNPSGISTGETSVAIGTNTIASANNAYDIAGLWGHLASINKSASSTANIYTGRALTASIMNSSTGYWGNLAGYYLQTLHVTQPVNATGNVAQVWLEDIPIGTVSGVYYGIKQEGSTALNHFAGDVEVATSGNGLILYDIATGTRHRVTLSGGVLSIGTAL